MIRAFCPGAWYGEILPSGSYAVLYPHSRVETHRGGIALPPGEPFGPRFVRCTEIGGFRFAGQADAGGAWEWAEGAGWRKIDAVCAGTSPVIYDRLGFLHLSDGSVGSQGWRYVDNDGTPEGKLVTGDATYRREVTPGVSLYEYTDLGWLLLGQGQEAGAVIWDGAALRLLEPGHCTFIRATVEGERVAIAMKKPEGVMLVQATLAELAALPPVVNQAPPIDNPRPPIVNPAPEPVAMEPKRLPDDVHAIVVALHAANLPLALGSDDDRRALQKKICETVRARKGPRWVWKSNHGIGIANAKDAIAEIPEGDVFTPNQRQRLYIWDLFNGGTREPNRQPVMSEAHDYEQFAVPVQPIDHLAAAPNPGTPAPNPGTPPAQPAPVPVDLAPILARIDAQAAVIADTNAALLRLAEVIEKLRIPAASSLTDLHGTVTIPYLGTGRVDLVAGKRK
jgi:hypothetical protein